MGKLMEQTFLRSINDQKVHEEIFKMHDLQGNVNHNVTSQFFHFSPVRMAIIKITIQYHMLVRMQEERNPHILLVGM
jgi:hypothetical protein